MYSVFGNPFIKALETGLPIASALSLGTKPGSPDVNLSINNGLTPMFKSVILSITSSNVFDLDIKSNMSL